MNSVKTEKVEKKLSYPFWEALFRSTAMALNIAKCVGGHQNSTDQVEQSSKERKATLSEIVWYWTPEKTGANHPQGFSGSLRAFLGFKARSFLYGLMTCSSSSCISPIVPLKQLVWLFRICLLFAVLPHYQIFWHHTLVVLVGELSPVIHSNHVTMSWQSPRLTKRWQKWKLCSVRKYLHCPACRLEQGEEDNGAENTHCFSAFQF